jgi:hypothetical protein
MMDSSVSGAVVAELPPATAGVIANGGVRNLGPVTFGGFPQDHLKSPVREPDAETKRWWNHEGTARRKGRQQLSSINATAPHLDCTRSGHSLKLPDRTGKLHGIRHRYRGQDGRRKYRCCQ